VLNNSTSFGYALNVGKNNLVWGDGNGRFEVKEWTYRAKFAYIIGFGNKKIFR